MSCELHLDLVHPHWKTTMEEDFTDDIFNTEAAEVHLLDSSDIEEENSSIPQVPQTTHTNPTWLRDLTRSFSSTIISRCSERTRHAVELDEDIKVPTLNINIFSNIIILICEGLQGQN